MWPFVRPKPTVVEQPAGTSKPSWAFPKPAPPNGKNVEVVTNLGGEILLRLTQDGFTMTLKMVPNSARELAGLLDNAADALDPEPDDEEPTDDPAVKAAKATAEVLGVE